MGMSKKLGTSLMVLALQGGAAFTANAVEITMTCPSGGQELKLCTEAGNAWAKKTGNTFKSVATAASSSEQLALYQQTLAAGDPTIDVFLVDIVWPKLLGQHLADMKQYVDQNLIDSYFPSIIKNNTVDGKLVAMPWYTDVGLIYYRKDLLEKYGEAAPETWDDLVRVAQKVQDAERKAGNDKLWGFVWQGRAYEGLTCNTVEWLDSYGAGAIIAADGKVTINNPKAVEALKMAASWIRKISPEGVLNYQEEESRGVFQSGNAVFLRSWPYVWALSNGPDSPVKDKVGTMAIPRGGAEGKRTGALGGWQLAVSKYSKNQAVAADLVKYMTGYEEQKRRAIVGSLNPTIMALYKDEDVLKASPFMGKLYDGLLNAVARPATVTGTKYNQVSNETWNAVFRILSGQGEVETNLKDLEQKLQRIGRNGKWS